jgi:hypothetical protein
LQSFKYFAKRAPIWYNFTTSLKKGAKKVLIHVYYTQNPESTREKAEESEVIK